MGKLCFGVDLGGTTVKMGVFTVEGSLLSDWEIPTRKEEKGKYILDDIAESIKAKLKKKLFHRRMLLVWESVFRVQLLQQA